MWPIVVFKVATECTEVKSTCTTCDTCEMEKISKSMANVTSAYPGVITRRDHSALDFKDTSAPIFGHSDVVFDIFLETRFLHLIALLSNFCKLFWLLGIILPTWFDFMSKIPQIPFIKHFC